MHPPEEYFDIIDREPQAPDAPNAVELTKVDGSVSFIDVEFSHPDVELIKNLNLQ